MEQSIDQITGGYGSVILSVVYALVILIGGWLLALILAAITRKILGGLSVDDRLAKRMGYDEAKISIEDITGKVVFWTVMLFVLVAIFQVLRLTLVAQSLTQVTDAVFTFLPKLLGAGVLALVAWIVATLLRFIVSKTLGFIKLDDKLADQVELTQEGRPPLSESLATIVYWFVWLLFLPAILGILDLQGLLDPVTAMVAVILVYLPNIIGAGLILLLGWFMARVIRRITVNFLAAIGTDSLGERVGIRPEATGGQSLSAILGTIVYITVLIPVLIAALQVLDIQAISAPATNMLQTLLDAIPAILGAAIILALAYLIGKIVADLVSSLLTSIGFNRVLAITGLGVEPKEGQRTLSEWAGYLVLILIMLFALIEASELLGFVLVAGLVAEFLVFAAQVALGVIILWLGLYLANLAREVIRKTAGANASLLAPVAWIAIVILATAMGLRAMGLADDIVNLAFGLLVGAIAVAVALAFGLGSRDIAARQVESWLGQLKSGDEE